jgi:hypothetical protein
MDLNTLIGRALSDEAFAQSLIDSPEAALAEAGFAPTPEILEALKHIDMESLRALASAFSEGHAA